MGDGECSDTAFPRINVEYSHLLWEQVTARFSRTWYKYDLDLLGIFQLRRPVSTVSTQLISTRRVFTILSRLHCRHVDASDTKGDRAVGVLPPSRDIYQFIICSKFSWKFRLEDQDGMPYKVLNKECAIISMVYSVKRLKTYQLGCLYTRQPTFLNTKIKFRRKTTDEDKTHLD